MTGSLFMKQHKYWAYTDYDPGVLNNFLKYKETNYNEILNNPFPFSLYFSKFKTMYAY